MQSSFDIPSPTESIRLTLARIRAAIEADRPIEAELVASELCAAWFVVAPDLQRSMDGMAAHPWGEWPNVRVMQDLENELDGMEDIDACLVLVRALLAMYTESTEAVELAAGLETRLVGRGATGPAWSLQFDAWRFERGNFVTTTEPGGGRPPGDWLFKTLEFSHPSGERCGLIVRIDPHNFNHVASIDVVDDYEREVEEMRLEIEAECLPLKVEDATEESMCFSMARSIKKTYLHEFEPLRRDLPSIGAFPLLCHLSEAIRLPEWDDDEARS